MIIRKITVVPVMLFAALFHSASEAHQGQVNTLDAHALPLGDGKVSTSPKRGYVYSCMSTFRGGGAQHDGGWIVGSTWDATRKIQVQGDVPWPDARFNMVMTGAERNISGNGLPLNHTTGVFPVSRNDPAFQIDHNPNRINSQQISLLLPVSPVFAASSGCVPMGMIGITSGGVALFNALDDAGRDAVAHEVQDHCNGHPQRNGEYHYHGPSPCMPAAAENNALIGYALDGFGIYSSHDENGKELTNADLDECHGRVSRINWDGKLVNMYHYVFTREYPYTVGCFRGNPVRGQSRSRDASPSRMNEGGSRTSPPESIAACSGLSVNAQCGFVTPRGNMLNGNCQILRGVLACVPTRR